MREGETQERAVSETELSLPEGTYRVTGSAPQYQDAVATVHVAVGRGATAVLTMKRAEKSPASSPKAHPAVSMDEWAKASASTPSLSPWTREGQAVGETRRRFRG